MSIRYAKVLVVGCVGLLMAIVGFDNIFDYETNFATVRHILAMDTLGPEAAFTWRAITSAPMHHLAYALIIAAELAASGLCLSGASRLYRARGRSTQTFNAEKRTAVWGLVTAFTLYFLGFMIIGGEWFEMWRSQGWNMQEPAFRFIGSIGVALIFVSQNDGD